MQIRKIFLMIDEDRSNTITADEVQSLLEKIGVNTESTSAQQLIQLVDMYGQEVREIFWTASMMPLVTFRCKFARDISLACIIL